MQRNVRHDTTSGLDTKGQGADIDEKNVLGSGLARENTTLDGSSVGNGLIGVDTLRRSLAVEVLLEEGLDLGNSGRSTNENNLWKVGRGGGERIGERQSESSKIRYTRI